MDQRSAVAAGFVGSVERSEDGGGGNALLADEAKLFMDGKFGAGKPNGGNAPNGGIDGKPIGRPQGRSKQMRTGSLT